MKTSQLLRQLIYSYLFMIYRVNMALWFSILALKSIEIYLVYIFNQYYMQSNVFNSNSVMPVTRGYTLSNVFSIVGLPLHNSVLPVSKKYYNYGCAILWKLVVSSTCDKCIFVSSKDHHQMTNVQENKKTYKKLKLIVFVYIYLFI